MLHSMTVVAPVEAEAAGLAAQPVEISIGATGAGPGSAMPHDRQPGPMRIARLHAPDATILSDTAPSCQSGPSYLIVAQQAGHAHVRQTGITTLMEGGDIMLCEGTAPLTIRCQGAFEAILLHVPAAILAEHLPSPQSFCGQALRSAQGVTATASRMTAMLFERLACGVAPHYQDRVARHLLDVLATAFALVSRVAEESIPIASGRCAQVKLFIEQHLRDPGLTPCLIASRMQMSSPYLRNLFAQEGETVSAYILRRRLEQCARQISDPAWRGHSMAEIAFRWGFNSAPHFTRTFRDRFDMAPREYRRQKLGDDGAIHRHSHGGDRREALDLHAA